MDLPKHCSLQRAAKFESVKMETNMGRSSETESGEFRGSQRRRVAEEVEGNVYFPDGWQEHFPVEVALTWDVLGRVGDPGSGKNMDDF